jgi:ABC-type molybdenum transport system ATPase subunit/photorepair protein PhrA
MRDDSVKQLRAELVTLLQKQVEALELETYVGLTDPELREYYRRQERIRDLKASLYPRSIGLPAAFNRNR